MRICLVKILLLFLLAVVPWTTKSVGAVCVLGHDTLSALSDSVVYQQVASNYISEIENLLVTAELEEKARKAVELSEKKLLEEEMSFDTHGVQPLLRGVVMKFTEDGFVDRPGTFRRYGQDFNDYLVAGAPLATSWMLKAVGVESRSSTRRMALSNVMALAISSGFVKGMKLSFDEKRPDANGDDSFPSGHSSFAFVSATILHREFGHHSPWISVGGYATATATQMLRIKHNRHWVHDVFVGAGIGMVSTNLAYFITDRILGEKGVNKPRFTTSDVVRVLDYNSLPTSISLVSGVENGTRKIGIECLDVPETFEGKAKISVGTGFMAGVEGSWFFNSNIAIDGMLKLTTQKAKISVRGNGVDELVMNASNLDFYRFNLGARYSYLMGFAHRFSLRVFAGVRYNDKVNFTSADDENMTFSLPRAANFDKGVSLTYDCVSSRKYSYGFNIDYHHTSSDVMPHRYGVSTVWKILL